MSKISGLSWSVLLFVLIVGAWGCYEPTTACLDLQATNFDVDADEACSDCCTFPAMNVQFFHLYQVNDTTFETITLVDSAYVDAGGNLFRFNQVQFYISDFQLLRQGGSGVGVIDTVGFETFDPTSGTVERVVVEDNFLIANPLVTSRLTIGDIRESGSFTGIRFLVGLEGQNNQALPSTLDDTHPLSLQDPSMYISAEEGYLFTRMELFPDTLSTTSAQEFTYGGAANLKEIILPVDFVVQEGFDVNINIIIDYTRWFSNISVPEDIASDQLTSKIVDNLTKDIFTILAVE